MEVLKDRIIKYIWKGSPVQTGSFETSRVYCENEEKLCISAISNNSLSRTTWNCKYHIVFAPKYRRKIIYNELRQDIANILSMLCKRKEVHIVKAEVCPDHIWCGWRIIR